MKRIARKPALLSKARVKTLRREVQVPTKMGPNHFYTEIARRSGKARVCVIRSLGGIGDVLMATPALRELKRRFPEMHLTYAVDRHRTQTDVYANLVKNAPFIDEVVDARYVRPKDYDACVDISAVCIRYERSDLPKVNRIDLFARRMGVTSLRNKLPFYLVEREELVWARQLIRKHNPKQHSVVVLHTASFSEKRTWPIKHYKTLIAKAEAMNLPIKFVVLDFNGQYKQWNKHSNVINCSNTDVRQMTALIAVADLFIGPDSGPMHLAGAVKTKSLVIFGSVPPEARINHYKSHEAIQHPNLSCLGCWYKACPYSYKCMRDLEAGLVYNRMIQSLGISNGS